MRESGVATRGRGSGLDDRGLRTVSRLRPEDWLDAAQRRLVNGGIDAVKIGPLAEDLKVTRGSFYWHFRDRNHLLETLLSQWRGQSHEMFDRLVGGDAASGMEEFVRLVHLWIDESEFDPALESAMRDWARTSDDVSAVVKAVDEERIAYIKRHLPGLRLRGGRGLHPGPHHVLPPGGVLHDRLQRIAGRPDGVAPHVRLRADRQVRAGRDRRVLLTPGARR